MGGEHLSGPWQAFLGTEDGDEVFTSLADVPDGLDVGITVLRGTIRDAALTGVMPDSDDDLNELDILYLVTSEEVGDWEAQLPVRWAQAQAVAEALNARVGQSSEPGA